ncbi:MAG: type II toxin-antitoxin system VapB family antitoxin [Acidobacteriota bacterium]
MGSARRQMVHKHVRLDQNKLSRAQRLLGAGTETETIERALEEVIQERRRNRQAWAATERFLKTGIKIRDLYRQLEH